VKIRRPGVAGTLRRDARLLRSLAALAARTPPGRTLPIVSLVEEIIGPLVEQADFRIEAESNRRLRRSFACAEGIRVPALIEELCVESVLTLEFVADMQPITSARLSSDERARAALVGLRALYRMILVDGFVHADMHDGNVFVRRWGEFVMLDTGFVARLTPSTQRDFIDFFFAMVNGRGADCADIIVRDASGFGSGFSEEKFRADICALVQGQARRRSAEFELSRFVADLFVIQRKWQVRGSTDFIMTIVAMLVFEGICKQLYPACDFQGEARGFLVIGRYAGTRLESTRADRSTASSVA
jgi:ubiquinone biosynthesis protein